jgi:hypothetical protein
MQIAILNTSILTAYGMYCYRPLSLSDVRALVAHHDILSAVGHASTAQILTELLGVDVPMNRIQFVQEVGQQAIVFKLKGRMPEGQILTREAIDAIGYEFGLLVRNA